MPKRIDIDLPKAQEMRDNGASWEEIGAVFGITGESAHRKLDPAFAAHRRAQIYAARAPQPPMKSRRRGHVVTGDGSGYRAVGAEADRAADAVLATIEPDTRTWQEKLFGDPSRTRSALARRTT